MDDLRNSEVNSWLSEHTCPPPSGDLAARIIAASQEVTTTQTRPSLAEMLHDWIAGLALPAPTPAYAFYALLLGVAISGVLPADSSYNGNSNTDLLMSFEGDI